MRWWAAGVGLAEELIRLRLQQLDPMLFGAVELLQTGNDLPNVRTCGEPGSPVMPRASEDNAWVVALIDTLDDELIQ